MRVAIAALPVGFTAQVTGNVAVVTYGPEKERVSLSVATDGVELVLFPERSYRHDDLVRAIGQPE